MLDMNNPDVIKFRAEYDALCQWRKEECQKIYEKENVRYANKPVKDSSAINLIEKEFGKRWKVLQQKYNYLYSKEEKQAE